MNGTEMTTITGAAEPEFRYIESKFTVTRHSGSGGDWDKNAGGTQDETRVTFEGYVTPEMYAALIHAIEKVVD